MNAFDFDKESFDKIALTYEECRPGYGKEVYNYIDSIKPYSSSSLILEVGAGSGIATKEITDKWNSRITALEPGGNLRSIAETRLKNNQNVEIIGSTFENYSSNGLKFDGIFSATAFHWIDPEIKYKKASELLKDDGLLVLYWNNYGIKDGELSKSIEELYAKYGMKTDNKNVHERQAENITRRRNEIEDSGLFHVIKHNIFNNWFAYSTQRYLNLLKTFSDHSKRNVPDIDSFYHEVSKLIDWNDGIIDVDIKVNLEIAART